MTSTALPSAKPPFWTLSPDAQCKLLGCGQDLLATADAADRLKRFGKNADAKQRRVSPLRAILCESACNVDPVRGG